MRCVARIIATPSLAKAVVNGQGIQRILMAMGSKDLQASACKILSAVAKQDAQCQELLGSIDSNRVVTKDRG